MKGRIGQILLLVLAAVFGAGGARLVTEGQKAFCKFMALVLPAKSGALLQSVWFPGTDIGMGAVLGFFLGLTFVVLWGEAEDRNGHDS